VSRPKSYDEARITTALRLPRPLHARLKVEADERDVSVNWLITRAIERYLDAHAPSPGDRDDSEEQK